MKAIRPTTSEGLHSQSETGGTNEWSYQWTDKPKNYLLSFVYVYWFFSILNKTVPKSYNKYNIKLKRDINQLDMINECIQLHWSTTWRLLEEKFEDTKGVIGSRTLTKDKQYNTKETMTNLLERWRVHNVIQWHLHKNVEGNETRYKHFHNCTSIQR